MKNKRKILYFHLGSLGDSLMVTPVIDAKRREFPEAQHLMLSNYSDNLIAPAQVFQDSGLIDDFIYYKKPKGLFSFVKLLWQLRKEKFTDLVYLVRNPQDRWQRDKKFFSHIAVKNIIGSEVSEKTHILDQLAERTGLTLSLSEVQASFKKLHSQPHPEMEKVQNAVAIGMGGKKPFCKWPFENYRQLIRSLIEQYGVTPVFFGGRDSFDDAENLISSHGKGINYCGRLNVNEGLATLAKCRLFIGNDSGTIHMAAAAGIKCLGIYSSHDLPGLWHPYGEGHIVLRNDKSRCAQSLNLEHCDYDNECINSISVDKVLQEISASFRELLSV